MYRWTKVNDLYSVEAFVSRLIFDPENNDPEVQQPSMALSIKGNNTAHKKKFSQD